ncbi:MAG TPA: 2-C-methyl-D-erythritol 4-phosphate cytidylyltransferase [Steroidobacteraceae bacterium]|nr:2-C-methyl-D-erythritol 4-phosphate cytidylyltransferase [Steroidobacteraceae bacterium]
MLRYGLVMPAAGAGRRFGSPKQYQPLMEGRSVLATALQPFLADPRCAAIALVLAGDDPQRATLAARLPAKVRIVDGGAERSHSVSNGLRALLAAGADPAQWILVHDAVRPCLSARDLESLLASAGDEPVGALLAAPLADTLKQAPVGAAAPRAAATLDRSGLWRALTPQLFRLQPLLRALEAAHAQQRSPTDDAQAMEWQGLQARLVAAQDANPKITTAEDLLIARAILAARGTGDA